MATLETKNEMNNLNVEDKPEKEAYKGIDQRKSIVILNYILSKLSKYSVTLYLQLHYKYTFNKYTTVLDFFGGI